MIFVGGALLGAALAVMLLPLLPARPKLSAALERMGTVNVTAQVKDTSFATKTGSWLIQRLPSSKFFVIPQKDLALIGITPTKFIFNKAACAAMGFAFGILGGLYSEMLGLLPFAIPAVASLGLAALGWFIPDSILRQRAADARLEFVRCVSVFYQMVANERRSGRPPGVAMENAANAGRAWPFRRIAQELNRARYDRAQPWDALIRLSEETGVQELNDAARIIRLSGAEGAAVYESLRSSGKTLDSKLRNEDRSKAIKATGKVRQLTMIIAFLFSAMIIIPLALSLTQ